MTSLVRSRAGWRSAVPDQSSARASDAYLAALAAGLVGWNYLGGGFVWDDGPLIAGRLAKADWSQVLSLWTAPVADAGPGASYYRPLALTVLSGLGRLGPLAIHLVATCLHALSAMLMVRCCSSLRSPLLGALIFAVHPLVSEVLGWSSARRILAPHETSDGLLSPICLI